MYNISSPISINMLIPLNVILIGISINIILFIITDNNLTFLYIKLHKILYNQRHFIFVLCI